MSKLKKLFSERKIRRVGNLNFKECKNLGPAKTVCKRRKDSRKELLQLLVSAFEFNLENEELVIFSNYRETRFKSVD